MVASETSAPTGKDKGKAVKGGAKVSVDALPKPDYWQHRLQIWDVEKKKFLERLAASPHDEISITLPDGAVQKAVSFETTPMDIAKRISAGLANNVLAAKVNGEVWDINRVFERDSSLELLKFDDPDGRQVFWHSSAHILGQALERNYHGMLCTGPALESGFYYDMQTGDRTIGEEDHEVIQALVERIIKDKQPFERIEVPKDVALELFKYNRYKHYLLSAKVPEGSYCSVYRCGDLIDPCRGPHVPNTARVKAFKVMKNSAAYWLGDAANDALQRVYGVAFPDKKTLDVHLENLRLAAERDHRLLGTKQELFFFHPLSPGSCFFLPHGTRIYNKLQELIRGEYRKRGFSEVVSPNMFSIDLWKTSGHWENYHADMFPLDVEKQQFALKPMNCPGHCIMFKHRPRSHRELPLRLADFGVLHRNEASGALTGLTRVRRFQQDDAHIFCAPDQIEGEITGAIDFLQHIYGIFQYKFDLELSTRPAKFLGEISVWDAAEKALEGVLNKTGLQWKLNPGDGAFYGPKIDIHITDALGRSHQCATIQLDFQLPIRFGLEFQDDKGTLSRPVIIHRAILGSLERMIAILIEHTGGKWPFWISPRQVVVIPVSEKSMAYAQRVRDYVHDAGFYADLEDTEKKMQKKIREAQLAQYNYILVVGASEEENGSVNLRTRDNVVHGEKKLDELVALFADDAKNYR